MTTDGVENILFWGGCVNYAENTLDYVEILTVKKIDEKAFAILIFNQ